MSEWTAADWISVIGALSAAIISVIAALRGQRAEAKADTVVRLAGASMMQPQMMPGGAAMPPGVNLGQVFRFVAIVEGVGDELDAAAPGEQVHIPPVKGLKISGNRCTLKNAVLEKE